MYEYIRALKCIVERFYGKQSHSPDVIGGDLQIIVLKQEAPKQYFIQACPTFGLEPPDPPPTPYPPLPLPRPRQKGTNLLLFQIPYNPGFNPHPPKIFNYGQPRT